MAVKLVDLADELGIKVADVRDYIDLLDLDVPKSALEVSNANATILRDEIAKDFGSIGGEDEDFEDGQEVDDEVVEEEIPDSDDRGDVDMGKAHEVEEAVEAAMDREIKRTQKKSMAGKKEEQRAKSKKQKESSADEVFEADVRRSKDDVLVLPEVITVKEFAERASIPVAKVIGELMKNGILVTINQKIDFETAAIVAQDFDVKVEKRREEASVEQLMEGNIEHLLKEDDLSVLVERPPVVVVMGHVDHGKTSILDSIRKADVVSGESGGITQHIGAYQVKHKGKVITFLDTPGHEAFTEMRARGAKVTDIVVLVVAADEGVKPQTEEAYDHAKVAGVPIVIVLNKIDKPDVDIEKVKAQLGQKLSVELEEWGGSVPVVGVSGLTGEGIQDLLDHLLLVSEMEELKANPERLAVGTVIESRLDKSLGPIATVLVNTGTLQMMDNVVVGAAYGRIKRMIDWNGNTLRAVGPSGVAQIAGLSEVPMAGDILMVMKDEKIARDKASDISTKQRMLMHASSFVELIARIKSGQLKTLKIVLKADTKGSLEALRSALSKIDSNEVEAQVIHGGVGAVSLNDVHMAAASMAVVMGFHVLVPAPVQKRAELMGVEVRGYKIIYKLLDDVKQILEGLLDPEIIETEIGEAEVLQIFYSKKKEMIIGCKVKSGKMENKAKVRVLRGHELIGEGAINSLQKGTESVTEMKEGHECGIRFEGNIKVEAGDMVQAYKVEKRKKTL